MNLLIGLTMICLLKTLIGSDSGFFYYLEIFYRERGCVYIDSTNLSFGSFSPINCFYTFCYPFSVEAGMFSINEQQPFKSLSFQDSSLLLQFFGRECSA